MKLQILTLWLASLALVVGQGPSAFSPARPPAMPLAVKSPYMSTWQTAGSDGGNGGYLIGEWATHWDNQVTAWSGMIIVDGLLYTFLGYPLGNTPGAVYQMEASYTSTSSVYHMQVAGHVNLTLTFLSPVTPNDMMRQSLVFSYLHIDVVSIDGKTHNVQLYTDISAEWVSGARNATAQWSYGVTGDVAYHMVARQEQLLFSETNDQADWGNWYYSTDNVDSMTYQAGQDSAVRGQFAAKGVLLNTVDQNFRAINDAYPVFGYAVNLGTVGTDVITTLFSIGLCQEQAGQFEGASGLVTLPSLWTSYFATDLDAVAFFHGDYGTSSGLCTSLDNQIATDSNNNGDSNYLTITSLSLRQAFAGTQLMGSESKYYLFLKELSSSGNIQTVDVIFPTWPVMAYLNPTLVKLMLDPLFENQEAGDYPNQWAMHDLGFAYPNATGHNDGGDEPLTLEECGNMIIMTLDYAQRANDIGYLHQHYNILRQWTDYAVGTSLYPYNQNSTDDFAGPLANQTNLGLKGIISIGAMGVIANLTGNTNDANNFTSIAEDYIGTWQTLSLNMNDNPPHAMLNYNNATSHGTLYNLFADAVLKLGLVPQSVYNIQSNFYPTVANTYGVPLDSRHNYTKSDWSMFAASIASPSTKTMFIDLLAKWIPNTPTNRAFTDLYDTIDGDYAYIPFIARSVVGGHFASILLGISGVSINTIQQKTHPNIKNNTVVYDTPENSFKTIPGKHAYFVPPAVVPNPPIPKPSFAKTHKVPNPPKATPRPL